VIYERLKKQATADTYALQTDEHLKLFAKQGLRTLCLAKREVSKAEWAAWEPTYQEVSVLLSHGDAQGYAVGDGERNVSSRRMKALRGQQREHPRELPEFRTPLNSTPPPGGARVSGRASALLGVPGSAWHSTAAPLALTLISPRLSALLCETGGGIHAGEFDKGAKESVSRKR